jgi:hypothetical protein
MEKKYPIGVIEQLDKLQRHGSLSTDYCLGYKEGMNRILDEQAPTGAVWVKASEFKTATPVYRPYRKKAMEDVGVSTWILIMSVITNISQTNDG